MIELPVDESYAFDFLSILEVKLDKSTANNCADLQKKCNFYANNLQEQIGDDLFKAIQNSAIYKELKQCNKHLFETIDNCKVYGISARTIDKLNYLRFQLKTKLQKEFFIDRKMTETKLGY